MTALVLVVLGLIWAAILIPPFMRKRRDIEVPRLEDVVEIRPTGGQRVIFAAVPMIGVPACLALAYFGSGSEHVVYGFFALGLLAIAPRLLGSAMSDEPVVRVDRQGLRIRGSVLAWDEIEGIVLYKFLWYGMFAAVVPRSSVRQSRPSKWLRFDEAAAGYSLWSGIPLKMRGAESVWLVFDERGVNRLPQRRGALRRMVRALIPFGWSPNS